MRPIAMAVLLVALVLFGSSAADELVVSIDDGMDGITSLLQTREKAKAAEDKSKYVAIRSDDFDTRDGEKPEYHIRHLADSVVLTTLNSNSDKKNGAWILQPPLCPPGEAHCPAAPEGSQDCFSLESADTAGSYLSKMSTSDNIALRSYPFADVESATFCSKPGSGDNTHTTFESLAKQGFFLTHVRFSLKLCNNQADTTCGVHDNFDKMSTFEQMPAMFFGRCTETKDGSGDCTCIDNFVGKTCDLECPGGCGDGECTEKHGGGEAFCDCAPGSVGPKCAMRCPQNEATGLICGAVGPHACALKDGAPKCQCGIGFRGEACQAHCPAFDEQANTVCSNAGNCTMMDNAGVGERTTKCNCKDGYIGGSCQLQCPRGDDLSTCSGAQRGTCVLDDENSEAKCKCQEGFSGSTCKYDCPRDDAENVCSGHGKCVEQAGGLAAPICDCQEGFTGPACQAECPALLAGTSCSGHGNCFFTESVEVPANKTLHEIESTQEAAATDIETAETKEEAAEAVQQIVKANLNSSTKDAGTKPLDVTLMESAQAPAAHGTAKCTCDNGFGGTGCEKVCLRDSNGVICSGHGACKDDGACACEDGFVGPSCAGSCPGVEISGDEPCTANGECKWNPTTDMAECKCEEGFLGLSCAYACPRGGSELSVCSNKGQCVMQRGIATCVCEDGIKGKACQLDCPGANEQNICNGHGFCKKNGDETQATCTCDRGFLGSGCLSMCPGLQEDGSACSGRGTCNAGETEQDPATCTCHDGHKGAGCEVKCPGDQFGNICSGAGKCELRTGPTGDESAECACFPGRVNYNCDTACPSNTADGTVCSGHGECDIKQNTDNYGNVRLEATCTCQDGYLGNDCFHGCPTAPGNTNDCSGHGICKLQGGAAICKCSSGWSGGDCNERVCGSLQSFFNKDISKCTCEAGFTCCSRESSGTDSERDVAIEMLQQENGMMVGKIKTMKQSLAAMAAEDA